MPYEGNSSDRMQQRTAKMLDDDSSLEKPQVRAPFFVPPFPFLVFQKNIAGPDTLVLCMPI